MKELRKVLRPAVEPLAAVVRLLGRLVGQGLAGKCAANHSKPARPASAFNVRAAHSAAESDRVQRSASAFDVQPANPDQPANIDELGALTQEIQRRGSKQAGCDFAGIQPARVYVLQGQ